ncbi:ABC transporter permease [Thiohalorhabdus sp. Cl-TMA]|uniref:ABC transporter permease n=1 Tax=Thiohalorhabdus methylotrophus TaxID=3242694 RepID=A0ABV4TPV2_9GAMM
MGWHAWTAIRLGLRRRSLFFLLVLGLLVIIGGALFSSFSGRQPTTVAMNLSLSTFRIIGVLLALFWIQELFVKELEQGRLHTLLSLPRPREQYLLGRFLGIGALLAGTLLLFGVLLWWLGFWVSNGYSQGTPVHNGWPLIPVMAYLWLDLLTITAFALLMGTLSTTPLLPFGLGLAFAWAARTLGPVLGYLYGSQQTTPGLRQTFGDGLQALQWALPDLSRLDLRAGVLYGQWPPGETMAAGAGMALGYTILLLGLAVWRFNIREFS